MAKPTRTPLMAGNWKMNLNHAEAVHLVQKLALTLSDKKHDYGKAEVVVVPPFTDLRSVQTMVDGDHLQIKYGAQDVSVHDDGAYTGEISSSMLAKLGCSYVVVGHSERREYHGESDAIVNAKAQKALAAGMTPIVCVGEGLAVRQEGRHVEHTLAQVDGSLEGFTAQQVAGLVVAYEPVWAIGTGEVSAAMLAGWCHWVIVGHSERREQFGETDALVARKAAAALEAGLEAIVCVGELGHQYEAGLTEKVVTEQVRGSLALCAADDSSRLVVAYEPVWAIGSGKNADPEHAYKTMRLIRSTVGEMIGAGAARRVRVLYGGSVNADNVEHYVELPLCDGCLVGGASLKAEVFSKMIEITAEVYGHTPHGAGT